MANAFLWRREIDGSFILIGHRKPSKTDLPSNCPIHIHKIGEHYEPIVDKRFEETSKALSRTHGLSMQQTQALSLLCSSEEEESKHATKESSLDLRKLHDEQIEIISEIPHSYHSKSSNQKSQQLEMNAELDHFETLMHSIDDKSLLQHA
eukprot:TCONS_00073396-protein